MPAAQCAEGFGRAVSDLNVAADSVLGQDTIDSRPRYAKCGR